MRPADGRRPQLVNDFLVGPDGGREPAAPRILVVHPGALPTSDYRLLAAELPPGSDLCVLDMERIPEYFQAALSGGRAQTTVEELAGTLVRELRDRVFFDRAWTLVGWSFGGVVGHALTSVLAEGELPRRMVLLDSIAAVPEYICSEEEIEARHALRWFCMYLSAKRGGTAALTPPDPGTGLDEALTSVLHEAMEHGVLLPGTTLPGLRKVYDTYLDGLRRNNRLAELHQPDRGRVPVTLLRPEKGLLPTPDPLGWSRLATDLTVGQTPGDHYSMLRDPVAVKSIALAAT